MIGKRISREPLRVPSNWQQQDRAFVIQLERVLDDVYARINAKTEWETIYPVGSIYMSVNSTSPDQLFGGTWERLKDRFLVGAGDTYTGTGGAASVSYTPAGSVGNHTLTTTEIPSHSHGLNSHKHSVGAHSHGLNSHTHSVGAHAHGLNSHTHSVGAHSHGLNSHTHGLNSHTHNVPAHNHTLNSHTHNVPAHNHGLNSHTHNVPAHNHGLNSHTHGVGTYAVQAANGTHKHKMGYAQQTTGYDVHAAAVASGNVYTALAVGSNTESNWNMWGPGDHAHGFTGSSAAASGNTADKAAFATEGPSTTNTADKAKFATEGPSTTNTGDKAKFATEGPSTTNTTGPSTTNTANSDAFNTGAASGNTANSTAFDTGAASGSTANSTAFDSGAASGDTSAAGGGGAHNHGFTGTAATIATTPPYLAVYMWKRTA